MRRAAGAVRNPLAVNIRPIINRQERHLLRPIVYAIDDSPVAHSYPVRIFAPPHLLDSIWTWITPQSIDVLVNAREHPGRERT